MKKETSEYKFSVNFNLKDNDCKKETLIYVICRWDNERVKISTKENVFPNDWDKAKQEVKDVLSAPNSLKVNNQLSEIKKVLKNTFKNFITEFNRKPSKSELKDFFDLEYFQKQPQFKKEKVKSILDYFDIYI